MAKLRDRYGNLFCFQWHGKNMVFAIGPEYNREIHARTDLFHSRPIVQLPGGRDSAHFRLRQSIFSLNDQEHHEMRHELLPPFQRSQVPSYRDSVVDAVGQVLQTWRPGQQRDLHQEMHRLVWGVVRKVLYGLEENKTSEALYVLMKQWMNRAFSQPVRWFPYNVPFTPYRRMLKEADELEQKVLELIQTRRREGLEGSDAFSALLRMRQPNGQPVADADLVGHAMTLFLVAYETTGNTLTWTLFLLAQHPHVLNDLLDELAPWQGRPLPAAQIERPSLLDRVLKESMRLFPAVPHNRRVLKHDGSIGPYFLARRSRVYFSHYLTHHMPEIYPEPERFLPGRWESLKPAPGEYLPFGMGVKTCLGAAVAQFVMKTALSMILPSWRLTLVPHTRIDRHFGITLGPRSSIPIFLAQQDRRFQVAPVRGNVLEMVDLRPVPTARSVRAAA